jgi:hypothetical protein
MLSFLRLLALVFGEAGNLTVPYPVNVRLYRPSQVTAV